MQPRAFLLVIALVASATSDFQFSPIQPDVLTAAGTLVNAFADYDGDGDPDLFVGFNGTPNRLYRNDRGTFVDVASDAGIADARPTRAAAWGDADADGDPDLLVGFAPGAGPVLRLYANSRGLFGDITEGAGLTVAQGAVRQLSWVDLDGDRDLDLFVAFRDRPNALFRNEAGRFRDVAGSLGLADARKSVGAVWFDYDEDGDLDLYVGNMDGDANGLFRNDGGTFTDVAESAGLQWGGRKPKDPAHGTVRPCVADVDGDGHFDLFMANYGPNGLFLNRGGGRFDDVSASWGVAIDARYDTCAFSDVDGDGLLDLYVNGTVTGGVSYRDYLFHNTGKALEDVTPESLRGLEADHGVAWADVDGDSAEDLALTGAGQKPMPLLFRRTPSSAAAIRVRPLDARGHAMLPGAEVRVYAAGSRRLLAARLVDSGSGYNAQGELPLLITVPAAIATVDIVTTFAAAGRRLTATNRNVDVRRWMGRRLDVKVK